MFGMILANNAGGKAIWPLTHAEWDGLTPTDLIFPAFLFISGLAITLAVKKTGDPGEMKTHWLHLAKRVALLFVIGLFLNLFSSRFTWDAFRVMGILQRIALCYGAVAAIHLTIDRIPYQLGIIAAIEVIYLGIMYGLDVPYCGRGNITQVCNAGAYIDHQILGNHCYSREYNEPEGLLSTLSAITTMYIGYLFGRIMGMYKGEKQRLGNIWFLIGGVCAGLMGLLSHTIPLNKKIWSFTFGIFTGAAAGLSLTLIMIAEDILLPGNRIVEFINQPFLWYGMNPLCVYVGNIFVDIILLKYIAWNDWKSSLWTWLYEKLFESWLVNEYLASLVFALFHVTIWMVVAWYLYKKKIYIKL